MKIAALLFTAVVVLNFVDKSSQSTSRSRRRISSHHSRSSSSSESYNSSESSSSPKRREHLPLKPRFPNLPQGSRIIRGFDFPRNIYYKVGHAEFWELLLSYDAVLNYERKIVAVFLETWENELYGLYYGKGGPRVKINPTCMDEGPVHYAELDAADYHYYPEFHYFEKPAGIISESLQAYRRLGRGLSCDHTPEARSWYFDLPPEAHIVRGVQFPQGFFFKIDQDGLFHPLVLHNCDVVVDQSKMIVAVFLGPSEYILLGIYRGEGGQRVKLTHLSMEAEHFPLTDEEESELYIEFMVYKKPSEMFRNSFEECG